MDRDLGAPGYEHFEGRIVRYDDAPAECTIYPRDVDEHRRTTAWVTAREGSYCSVEFMR